MNFVINKYVLVTGGSRGLGKALAESYASMGYQLILVARDSQRLEEVKRDIESRHQVQVHVFSTDLSLPTHCHQIYEQTKELTDKIDVLVNNAGVFCPGDVLSEEEGTLEKLISNNLYSAYYLTRAMMPLVQKSEEGMIVNIASVAGLEAYENGGSYSISKFALRGFSLNLRKELQNSHVRVTTVYPGAFYSDSWKDSTVSPDRMMKPEDVAQAIADLVKVSPQTDIEELILRPQKGDI